MLNDLLDTLGKPLPWLLVGGNPALLDDLQRLLGATGHRAAGLASPELKVLIEQRWNEIGSNKGPYYRDLVVRLDSFDEFDGWAEMLYGGLKGFFTANFLENHSCFSELSRRPRFLIAEAEPDAPDLRTFLGAAYPSPYMRWNLDDLFGVESLRGCTIYEPDASLIRLLIRGSNSLRFEQLGPQAERSHDCEQLAPIAEAAIGAAVHQEGPADAVAFKAIGQLCRLQEGYLARAVILAIGFGLAQVYEARWWSIVERISLDRLCAEVGLKRERCGEPESRLWSRVRRGLTRIDRWSDLLNEDWNDEWNDEMVSLTPPKNVAPPSASEMVRRAIDVARVHLPRVFAELQLQQDLVESYSDHRPVLVAREVEGGWSLRYVERGHPPQMRVVKNRSGRMSRILFPLAQKLCQDIENNMAVDDCGWVPTREIDPRSAASITKFRKDKSDLNRELQAIGLGIETKQGKIRLEASLAVKRARIEILRD